MTDDDIRVEPASDIFKHTGLEMIVERIILKDFDDMRPGAGVISDIHKIAGLFMLDDFADAAGDCTYGYSCRNSLLQAGPGRNSPSRS